MTLAAVMTLLVLLLARRERGGAHLPHPRLPHPQLPAVGTVEVATD
jgi:hypothetical protein